MTRSVDARLLYSFAFIAALAVCPPSTAARAYMLDSDGMKPWESCALCHGLDGVSRMAKFPKLATSPTPISSSSSRISEPGAAPTTAA